MRRGFFGAMLSAFKQQPDLRDVQARQELRAQASLRIHTGHVEVQPVDRREKS